MIQDSQKKIKGKEKNQFSFEDITLNGLLYKG